MKKNVPVKKAAAPRKKRLNLGRGDRAAGIAAILILLATAVLTLLQRAHLALIRGELLLFLPFLLLFLLLGWGASALVRRIRRPVLRTAVGVILLMALVFLALVVFSYVSFVATLTVPQPYNTVRSPSGAHRLVVLRTLDDDEARVSAHRDARLEADPGSNPEIAAEDWFYRYTAYPTVAGFFYRSDADVDGEVIISYADGGTLMMEWSDDEREVHFFVSEPREGEGGDLYVRF